MARAGPLVDTSVLIDYFAGVRNRETDALDFFLRDGSPPAIAPVIVQEYLQGLTVPEEFKMAQADLQMFDQLTPPDYPLHVRAAENHTRMKRAGLTIPTVDTLIVTMAQTAGRSLLTRDRHQRDLAASLRVALA